MGSSIQSSKSTKRRKASGQPTQSSKKKDKLRASKDSEDTQSEGRRRDSPVLQKVRTKKKQSSKQRSTSGRIKKPYCSPRIQKMIHKIQNYNTRDQDPSKSDVEPPKGKKAHATTIS